MKRPAESVTATAGIVVGAILELLAGVGVHVPDGINGPVVQIVSLIAAAVTWYVAKLQRAKKLKSATDGGVQTPGS